MLPSDFNETKYVVFRKGRISEMFAHMSIIYEKTAYHSPFCLFLFSCQLAICTMCSICNSPVTILKEVNSIMNYSIIHLQSTNIETANEIQPGDISFNILRPVRLRPSTLLGFVELRGKDTHFDCRVQFVRTLFIWWSVFELRK